MENTKKLSPSMAIPKKIQNLGKLIQFFSPTLAMKFAYKLFITPVKFKIPDREKLMRESAQIKPLFIDSLKKNVDVLEYGYSRKRVLLVHGWSGRGSQFYMIADKLLENGYMVVAFDAPAHLGSEGKTTNLLEFIEVIKQLWTEYDGFISAVGHSLGGVALYNIIKDVHIQNFVTIGAADKIPEITYRFVDSLGLKAKVAKKMLARLQQEVKEDINNYSSGINAKQINAKVLVVHDEKDADVAVHCAHDIAKELKEGTTLITSDLGHTRILRDTDTVNKIVDFIVTSTY